LLYLVAVVVDVVDVVRRWLRWVDRIHEGWVLLEPESRPVVVVVVLGSSRLDVHWLGQVLSLATHERRLLKLWKLHEVILRRKRLIVAPLQGVLVRVGDLEALVLVLSECVVV